MEESIGLDSIDFELYPIEQAAIYLENKGLSAMMFEPVC